MDYLKLLWRRKTFVFIFAFAAFTFAMMFLLRYGQYRENCAYVAKVREAGIVEHDCSQPLPATAEGKFVHISGLMRADKPVVFPARDVQGIRIDEMKVDGLLIEYKEEKHEHRLRGSIRWEKTHYLVYRAEDPHIGCVPVAGNIVSNVECSKALLSKRIDKDYRVSAEYMPYCQVSLIARCEEGELTMPGSFENFMCQIGPAVTAEELCARIVDTPKEQSMTFLWFALGAMLLTVMAWVIYEKKNGNKMRNAEPQNMTEKAENPNVKQRIFAVCICCLIALFDALLVASMRLESVWDGFLCMGVSALLTYMIKNAMQSVKSLRKSISRK